MLELSKNKFMLTLISVFTTCLAWGQPFYINGHKAVQDKPNGVWLCSIPQECFNTDWEAVVEPDSTWSGFTVNGIGLSADGTATFRDITGGKRYPFAAIDAEGQPISGEITFTFLPVIELNGEFGYEYVEGTVSINGPDTTSKNDMRAKLKWRGHYSNNEDKHKRNYNIKFLDKNGDKKNRSFYGMRKDNHWKLDAGQADRLRLRNRICNDLWLDMSVKPWYQELEPEAINGSRGKVTEVFLNGEYRGIYGLMEPVDRKQLQLVKHDTINNEFHGQLWFSRTWCRTATMSYPLPWDNNEPTWDGIELDYPDFEEVCPTDWSTLARSIQFINTMDTYDNWTMLNDSIGNYFDMPVMMDYFIFIVTIQALGNESINIYYSCYDKALNPPLTMTPWDLDNTFGSQHFPEWSSSTYSPERPIKWINNVALLDMFNHTNYHDQLIERYWQLRSTILDADSLISRFQQAIDLLKQSGAAERETALWSGDSDLYGRSIDFDDELNYIDDWIRRRLAYVDTNVFVRPALQVGDVNGDGEVNIADVTELIDILLGSLPTDITVADIDKDGEVTIGDVTELIDYILRK